MKYSDWLLTFDWPLTPHWPLTSFPSIFLRALLVSLMDLNRTRAQGAGRSGAGNIILATFFTFLKRKQKAIHLLIIVHTLQSDVATWVHVFLLSLQFSHCLLHICLGMLWWPTLNDQSFCTQILQFLLTMGS